MDRDRSPTFSTETRPRNLAQKILWELKVQRPIVLPLLVMNFTWFAKLSITMAFLGRLGELALAGASLGFTLANVTGFAVLNGLCCAMEPICGQAFGAKNLKLLHKTLVMAVLLLLLVSLPVAFLWLNVDRILICFGQQEDISLVAKKYLLFLLPDLVIVSFLCPLKYYLSAQSITIPIMLSTALAVALQVPMNLLLYKARGVEGVAMAFWMTDFTIMFLLAVYVVISENWKSQKWAEGGWWEQSTSDWKQLIKLAVPCCLTTCLEWWCYEILVLLTGRLHNAKQAVGIIAILLNFDYVLFSVMQSLATAASVRVSNELGANNAATARISVSVSLGLGVISGVLGSLATVGARGFWGALFTHEKGITRGVKKMMLILAVMEIVNFPLAVSGGIARGTARPLVGTYASVCGFYLLALPLGVILAFKLHLGLTGLLVGFIAGVTVCLVVLVVFIARNNWDEEAKKAQILACCTDEEEEEAANDDKSEKLPNCTY
ncbi:PREDICTED: protein DETOXIFICATION 56-like [Ipomoea nil]|uniref:protein DETOXIFICATION 56-like n=1 Tax=Ipomoea nil TaxID=35883 RepID=UPI00090133E6|nr:PREDICTED: protein DETOXIFICATION 56-like [Ipomoea nil]